MSTSLSRAFTTRRFRLSNESADGTKSPRRSASTTAKSSIPRHKISAPVELIHTTNMLSYNAPDLPRASRSNSTDTVSSQSDEDAAYIFGTSTAASTPPTSPEPSPRERALSPPQPNHLTTYFKTSEKAVPRMQAPPPAIPARSASHTKKSSIESVTRSRSLSRAGRNSEHSLPARSISSRPPSTATRSSSASRTSASRSQKQTVVLPPLPAMAPAVLASAPATTQQQPTAGDADAFDLELAKVTKLTVDNGGARLNIIDEEEQYLVSRGLVKVSADDYLGDILGLTQSFFPDLNRALPPAPVWI
ncbi:hypothetical protein DCS_01131 [Drechmeria coniospora]|uniref:Uncharacterized protein n=1 Tax=Drechmeria coniospora TaxID=98403 RepID=A0A151GSA6_DRECN|nr:hypothetical protein DCS_01131 [Drechmeria coniospora]KYK59997.1 hypothetical protein DCS_01131 [Drechmeria coniospora]ODA78794.1 hypothetical protein RJ55_06178 [Drechmeria coniospora]